MNIFSHNTFFFLLCLVYRNLCCQFLWIVIFLLLPLRYSTTFIYKIIEVNRPFRLEQCLSTFYYPLSNEVAKGYSNATVIPSFLLSVRPSFHNILVNTLESTSFHGFRPILIHAQSVKESENLLIFKVIGQRSRSQPGSNVDPVISL